MAAKKSNITPVKKTVVKRASRSSGLSAPLFTVAGTQMGEIDLPKELFGAKPNARLVAQAVRVYLSRQRQANAHTKRRADVNLTKKKVYKQKGTGGARHGAKSAPIFVGGGVAHGPKNIKNYKLELSKKQSQKAFIYVLSDKAQDKKVSVVKGFEKIEPKTRVVASFLKKTKVEKPLLVHSGSDMLYRAGKNIEGLSLVRADQLNTYDVLVAKNLLLTQEGLEILTKRIGDKKNA
ncbi:MAG: 50S ribosomal protein L4 [Patescibacteria group bacterium]